jgi:predicted RNA-binding protein with TRAM domain
VEFEGGRPHVKLEEGKEYTVRVVDSGKQGDGIARVAGMVVFVPGAKPGDEVRVVIERISRNCAFARRL